LTAASVPPFTFGDQLMSCAQIDWLVERLKNRRPIDLSCDTSPFRLWPGEAVAL